MSNRLGLLIADVILFAGFSVPFWFALYEYLADIRKRYREGRMNRTQLVIAGVLGVLTLGLFAFIALGVFYVHYWRAE